MTKRPPGRPFFVNTLYPSYLTDIIIYMQSEVGFEPTLINQYFYITIMLIYSL